MKLLITILVFSTLIANASPVVLKYHCDDKLQSANILIDLPLNIEGNIECSYLDCRYVYPYSFNFKLKNGSDINLGFGDKTQNRPTSLFGHRLHKVKTKKLNGKRRTLLIYSTADYSELHILSRKGGLSNSLITREREPISKCNLISTINIDGANF